MCEVINTSEHYYMKDFKNYSQTENNFVANQEITVNITLNEYRNLVIESAKAKLEIEKAEKGKWERDEENRKLKEEVKNLKDILYAKQIPKTEYED